MYTVVTECGFIQAFEKSGRGEQFSYEGLKALYAYLTELEEETGESIELDVVSLCCEYSEYDSIEEAMDDYGCDSRNDFENRTLVIRIPDTARVIIRCF